MTGSSAALLRISQDDDAERLQQDLWDLAGLVDRLEPDRRDPERFHLMKSAVAHELRRLARGPAVQREKRPYWWRT